jgi:pantoate--beta-alanine ligase
VATVVLKLFEIVQPHFAYFGRKDAQQVRILQQMTHDLNLNLEIVVCPIVREPDGLALSSRNTYLSSDERRAATALHRALTEAQRALATGTLDAFQLQTMVSGLLSKERSARVDYLEIVDAETFEPVARIGARPAYLLLAVYVGKTRLIDNLLIEPTAADNTLTCSL